MAAEHVLELFHTCWFETTVLTNRTPSSHLHSSTGVLDSTSQVQYVVEEQVPSDSNFLRAPTLQVVRSFSDQNLGSSVSAFSDCPSPNSVLTPQKLRPILSEKEVEEEFTLEKGAEEGEELLATKKKQGHRRRRFKKGKTTRSLSDLEVKELKGFMDLGFVFSEEDKDSKLVSLIPGLQRLGREDDDSSVVGGTEQEQKNKIDEALICRPYLSEAWGVLDHKRKLVNPLLNWRVPENEIDMKDNLRFWAHTVASIVR